MYPPPSPWPKGEPFIGVMEVLSLYFVGQHIPTSGYHFVNCRFDNCTFENGMVNMTNCQVNGAAAIRASGGTGEA